MPLVQDQKYFRFVVALNLILALLLFNGWFLYFTFQNVNEHEAWVAHTDQVLLQLDQVRASVVDMETGQRGFLLLHDNAFLEPYRKGLSEYEIQLNQLHALVADNPEQVTDADILANLVKRRVSDLRLILESEKDHSLSAARRAEALEEGRSLMAAMRAQIAKMKGIETELLAQRSEDVKRVRSYFLITLGMTTLISLLAVSIAARQIRKNQIRLEKDARERALIARTRESIANASMSIAGDLSTQEMALRVQQFLATKLHVLASKFYKFSGGRLVLASSYGTDDNKVLVRGKSLIDEAIGRSTLWWVDSVPDDYWQIGSGLGQARPKRLAFLPIAFQGRKLGVVEMAMFQDPSREDVEILEKLSEILAVGFSAAQSRGELQELLEKTQQQAEELEAQQEELKASNEELEQQARALESQQQSLNIKNRELEEVRIVLEEKARDLELSTQYKSDFLAKMSHELRTPLNGILILSTLLMENKEKNLTEQQKQFATSVHSAGNDLLLLINDILDLSKIEARKLSMRPEHFSIHSLVESLKLAFEPQSKAKDIGFKVEVSSRAKPIEMNTDRQRLEQVLRNFLSNALKFTEKGFVGIEVDCSSDGKMVEITVSDSGIGIPKNKQDLIFRAFEQADGSVSRKYGGTGLGLTISRELATLLGGEIVLKSSEGVGSHFTLRIPTVLEGTSERQAPQLTDPSTPMPEARALSHTKPYELMAQKALKGIVPGKRTILIVEDEEAFANTVAEVARNYGFQAVVASDGEMGMAILERHTPDAILLDIKLPGISGLGFLEMIKHMPQFRHIPVHMISALDYQHNALRMGALGYLTKPVTMEKVRSALSRIETMISGRLRKILLIEDDKRQSDAISSLISGQDVEIDSAPSGREAMSRLRENTYDCVILDLTLPDISGFDMLGELNSMEISVPPIVIYTAKDLTPQEEEYLRKYSESIIIKGARSPERLLDEVNLFLHRIESMMPHEKREMLSQLRAQKDNFEGKTVLIVDDDLRNVFALTSALESKNLNVRIAKDGIEALEVLEREASIDLVLMDIMMPRMDGFEAMRAIRRNENPRIRELPIVALTAKAMREDHEKCIEAGASDYIPKPVDMSHLTTILKVWLSPKGIFA